MHAYPYTCDSICVHSFWSAEHSILRTFISFYILKFVSSSPQPLGSVPLEEIKKVQVCQSSWVINKSLFLVWTTFKFISLSLFLVAWSSLTNTCLKFIGMIQKKRTSVSITFLPPHMMRCSHGLESFKPWRTQSVRASGPVCFWKVILLHLDLQRNNNLFPAPVLVKGGAWLALEHRTH